MHQSVKTVATLGVVYGNRDFFPDHQIGEARDGVAALYLELVNAAIQLEY